MSARRNGPQTLKAPGSERDDDPGTALLDRLYVDLCQKSGVGYCSVQCQPKRSGGTGLRTVSSIHESSRNKHTASVGTLGQNAVSVMVLDEEGVRSYSFVQGVVCPVLERTA